MVKYMGFNTPLLSDLIFKRDVLVDTIPKEMTGTERRVENDVATITRRRSESLLDGPIHVPWSKHYLNKNFNL